MASNRGEDVLVLSPTREYPAILISTPEDEEVTSFVFRGRGEEEKVAEDEVREVCAADPPKVRLRGRQGEVPQPLSRKENKDFCRL